MSTAVEQDRYRYRRYDTICRPFASKYKNGDTVKFGKYEQVNNAENGKEDIERIVLDPKSGLCISKYSLNDMTFDDSSSNYATSDVRNWLTGEFFTNAFTATEKGALLQKDIVMYKYNTTPISSTVTDKVFLLSLEEFGNEKYFNNTTKNVIPPLCNFKRSNTYYGLRIYMVAQVAGL